MADLPKLESLKLLARLAGKRLEWDGDPRDWQPMYYEGKTYHSFDPYTNAKQLNDLIEREKVTVRWSEWTSRWEAYGRKSAGWSADSYRTEAAIQCLVRIAKGRFGE